MTRKSRHFIYEGIAILFASMMGAFAIPTLINQQDTVALFAGLMLLLGWAAWTAFFLYRLGGNVK